MFFESLWLFLAYSFLGWVFETTVAAIRRKHFYNRGVINGPFCLIYGCGGLTITIFGGELHGIWLYIGSVIVATVVEWIAGHLIERWYHERWWDYSNRFLNLHGRVCLKGFVVFGALSVLMLRFVHPLVEGLVTHLPAPALHPICLTLLIILLADIFVTLKAVLHLPERLRQLKLALDARLPDIRWPDGFQLKRLMNAFPHLTFPRYPEQWKALLRHYGRRISLPARRRGAKKDGPGEAEPAKKED